MNLFKLGSGMVNVEQKITDLKQQLKVLKGTFHLKIYKILKEILELRQSQITNYKIRTLGKEKDIELTEHQIVYYFGFDYISPKSEQLIESGELNATTFLFILRKNVEFRKHELQDVVVERLLNDKITIAQIGNLPLNNLLNNNRTPDEINQIEKSIQFLARTRELSRQFDLLEDYIVDQDIQIKIKNCLNTLIKKINDRMKDNGIKKDIEGEGNISTIEGSDVGDKSITT